MRTQPAAITDKKYAENNKITKLQNTKYKIQ